MQYNTSQYNEQQYQYQLLAEILSLTEALIKDGSKPLNDVIFLTDNLTKQVTNKGLFDNVRLAEWLSKNRTSEPTWSD